MVLLRQRYPDLLWNARTLGCTVCAILCSKTRCNKNLKMKDVRGRQPSILDVSTVQGTRIGSSNFEPKKCIKKSGTQEFVRSSGHNSQRTILPDGEQSWRQALERLCILSSYESKRFLEAGDHVSTLQKSTRITMPIRIYLLLLP